jgi:hypothetical protein
LFLAGVVILDEAEYSALASLAPNGPVHAAEESRGSRG